MPSPQEIPNFGSMEEAEAYLEGMQSKPKPAAKKVAKSSKKIQNSAPVEVVDGKVWRAEHYYLREGYSWNDVLRDAKEASEFNNLTNKVYVHHHAFGEDCVKSCREVFTS